MTASSTSRRRTDDTPCRVEAGASLARATRSTIHLARSVHPAYLMALRPQLRFARSSASRTARRIHEIADARRRQMRRSRMTAEFAGALRVVPNDDANRS